MADNGKAKVAVNRVRVGQVVLAEHRAQVAVFRQAQPSQPVPVVVQCHLARNIVPAGAVDKC